MTVSIFSRIDRCIIKIIVHHLAHHTIAPMSSSGSTYIPWRKCEATVPEEIDVPMCFCGSLWIVQGIIAVRNSAWFILWTGSIAGIINFIVFVTLAHFLIMVHLAFEIKDLYLEVLDELLNRMNWCRIDPPSKTTVFWSIGRASCRERVWTLV